MSSKSSERRDGGRLDLQLRVRYAVQGGVLTGEGEATDVSPHGARIECKEPLTEGQRLQFTLDAGDGQGVTGSGEVTWCRPRALPSGRTVYDAGVRFDREWLRGDRGPLARALGRFFSRTEHEPARDFTRVQTSLVGTGRLNPPTPLTVTDLSEGGLRVSVEGTSLPGGVKVGQHVRVVFGGAQRVDATVAWVADSPAGGPARAHAQFGVAFRGEDTSARDAVRVILAGLGRDGEPSPTITLEVV